MDPGNINVYVFVSILSVLIVVVVSVTIGLYFCLKEMQKREIEKRERYLESIKALVLATSTVADATTRVQDIQL